MKKMLLFALFALLGIAFWLYADATMHGHTARAEGNAAAQAEKILIVYYSWGGNTRLAAEEIRQQTGGTLLEIAPATPYPADYDTCVQKAKEDISSGNLPELLPTEIAPADYDIIFIGSPNWWSTIAPPISSYLAQNDLSGKKVAFFLTHGGGGIANCERHVRALIPRSQFLGSIALRDIRKDSFSSAIAEWLSTILTPAESED